MSTQSEQLTKIRVQKPTIDLVKVRSSHTFYANDDDDDEDDDEIVVPKEDREMLYKRQLGDGNFDLLDMILSFGGFAKLIACIIFLSSAIVFNNATYDDHTSAHRKLNKVHMYYLILPACDISCAIAGSLVYVLILILMAKGHIRNMIVLDISYTLVVLLISLLASMVTLPEVGVVHVNAAVMMLIGTVLQVVSGFSTLIKYCPKPRLYRTSGSQI